MAASLKADRTEDVENGATICRSAMTVLTADPGQLASLRHALDPVYAAISQDPETKGLLAQIEQLKADVGAAPESLVCASDSPSTGEASVLDGSQWQVSFTRDELAAADVYDTGEWSRQLRRLHDDVQLGRDAVQRGHLRSAGRRTDDASIQQ